MYMYIFNYHQDNVSYRISGHGGIIPCVKLEGGGGQSLNSV